MPTTQDSPEGQSSYVLTGRDAERYFELNDALREFAGLFQNEKNERAAAIVGASFLDTLLEQMIVNFLVDDEKEVSRLLDPDQALGTFGNRIRIAYCLGFIGKVVRDDLRLVGKIRNRFAHDLTVSFESEPIRSWCWSLKLHEISMFRKPPEGATAADVFNVGVNQLVGYLHGLVWGTKREKRKLHDL